MITSELRHLKKIGGFIRPPKAHNECTHKLNENTHILERVELWFSYKLSNWPGRDKTTPHISIVWLASSKMYFFLFPLFFPSLIYRLCLLCEGYTIQCRLEIIFTLLAGLVAHIDIFLLEDNHCIGIKRKSNGSRWIFWNADVIWERPAIRQEKSWKIDLYKKWYLRLLYKKKSEASIYRIDLFVRKF